MHTLEQLRSGALAGTRRLDLSCGLSELPEEIFALADTLEVLNLSGNRLRELPHQLTRLHKLQVLFASDNDFEVLPEVLGDCPALHMVGFKANRIADVPAAALPPALRWLTLTDNAIGRLPTELGQRPALQKLMLAGNAMGWVVPAGPELPGMAWHDLTHGPLLGEGASGHIYQVQARGWPQPLALKLFKGEVTSDGLPEDELAACLAAGQHPALTTPVARLTGHPAQAQGLLMPLIPSAHVNLAGPPSLDSCTRDVYPQGFQLSGALALRIASDVTGAVAHLHQRGVMHGDVYAHNIHIDPLQGQARLGDFGAATRLPTDQPDLRQSLLALEVRALGYLLQELALAANVDHPAVQALQNLAQVCLSEQPRQRPSVMEMAQALEAIEGF